MPSQAELDEDERERAEFRRRSGIPEPKKGRPPLRRTPHGTSYRQGRPLPTAPAPAPPPGPADDQTPATTGAAPSTPPDPARGSGRSWGGSLAGLIVGLFLWGYAENALRGGLSQGNAWLKAKFLNETTGTASTTSTTTTTAARPPTPASTSTAA